MGTLKEQYENQLRAELKEKLEAILTEEEIEWEAMSRLQLP